MDFAESRIWDTEYNVKLFREELGSVLLTLRSTFVRTLGRKNYVTTVLQNCDLRTVCGAYYKQLKRRSESVRLIKSAMISTTFNLVTPDRMP